MHAKLNSIGMMLSVLLYNSANQASRALSSPPDPTFRPSRHLLPACLPACPPHGWQRWEPAHRAGRQEPPTSRLAQPGSGSRTPSSAYPPEAGRLRSTKLGTLAVLLTGTPDLPSHHFKPPRPRAILQGFQQRGLFTRAKCEPSPRWPPHRQGW